MSQPNPRVPRLYASMGFGFVVLVAGLVFVTVRDRLFPVTDVLGLGASWIMLSWVIFMVTEAVLAIFKYADGPKEPD